MDKIYSIKESTLTGMTNAVRSKTGKTAGIEIENMEAEIGSIVTGGSTEDLSAVLNAQEEIINRLETKLEGKANGAGGAMETCTVRLIDPNQFMYLYRLVYEEVSESSRKANLIEYDGLEGFDITLENVACGSLIYLYYSTVWDLSVNLTNAQAVIFDSEYTDGTAIFEVTATSNGAATIEFGMA